jgi:translation initiation factor IF-2
LSVTRVYLLAKELGVKSSAIVQKCQDEGLDVKNHMAVISAGLAATIREWFTEGENVTTVEVSDRVDLEKVRVKKKKTRMEDDGQVEEIETETAEESAIPTPSESVISNVEVKPEILQQQKEAAIASTEEIIQAPAEAAALAPVEVHKQPEQIAEPAPVVIVPAGPIMEKPAPAQLTGPKVVRMEAPEPIHRRPKPKSKSRYNEPVTEPLMYKQIENKEVFSATSQDKKHVPKRHRQKNDEVEPEIQRKSKIISKWRQRDIEERQARLEAAGGEGMRSRPVRKITSKLKQSAAAARPTKAVVYEPITVKNLSSALAVKATDIIAKLMQHGTVATVNQVISSEMAELIALEFDTELVVEHKITLEKQIHQDFEQRPRTKLEKRSVVAAVLGHVDHGKTSLLDKIRSSHVAAGEAGGITQHIGAYEVMWDNKRVTFLDTPGHEAFTAMRARGANMTDVVVLVVAADDGVMPQTIEAIAHSKAANVPIIVALNKIDLPGCDVNRIFAQLAEHGLLAAQWGGQTEVVKTSAVTGEGINDLLESLDYVAELLELKADNSIPATGWVVEARIEAKRGPVATLLVKEGQINKGDVVLAGTAYGRVKMLRNSSGKNIKSAYSSMPVEIVGLDDIPQAGDRFYCLDDINKAKDAAEEIRILSREHLLSERSMVTLDNLFSHIEAGKTETLNLIIKADVQGSVDVLKKYLSEMSTNEVKLNILHAAPGGISEGDVVLAEASNAIIIGFNVVPDDHAARMAENKGVEIRLYNIIYRITDDLRKSMLGLLEPEEKESTLGRAVVRQLFKVSRVGTIGGCFVNTGVAAKHAKVRLIRNNIVLKDSLGIETLKHFKNDAREVKAGLECGVKLAGFDDIKIDDVLEFYEIVKIARESLTKA